MPAMTEPLKIIKEFSKRVDLIIEDGNINQKGSEIRMLKKDNWIRIR